jgi:arginine-tRNA-protein transferase
MNNNKENGEQQLKLFHTHAHDCSYLPGLQARTLFVDPETTLNKGMQTRLAELGFRRSGDFVYRPNCENCNACVPVRIPVKHFKKSRSQRRIWSRNRDLAVEVCDAKYNDERYNLYAHYISTRHQDGDMYPPSVEQFTDFLINSESDTRFIEYRDAEKLVAIAVTDLFDNAYSAVYSFFDTDNHRASYGTYTILSQIEEAKKANLDYLYLGYWIKTCQKMSYKVDYRPIEVFISDRWTLLT